MNMKIVLTIVLVVTLVLAMGILILDGIFRPGLLAQW